MTEGFAADWLARREPYDARARSRAIGEALIAALPVRPRLLDLGAGSGALFRWLAPRLYRAQVWTLFDADAALLDEAFSTIARWAEAFGLRTTAPGRALLVHAPGGAWRVEAAVGDLADLARLPLSGQDAVLSSALCDLISARWAGALADRLTVPFYAALLVDGRRQFLPSHPADALLGRAFARDQARDKGFGPALGARAPAVLAEAFRRRGFRVLAAPSDWRIGRAEAPMLRELVAGEAEAALRAAPRAAARITAWQAARLAQIGRGRLGLRLGHCDLLAIPR